MVIVLVVMTVVGSVVSIVLSVVCWSSLSGQWSCRSSWRTLDHHVSRHVHRCCGVSHCVGDRVGHMLVVVVVKVVMDDCWSSFSRRVGCMLVVIVMSVVVS